MVPLPRARWLLLVSLLATTLAVPATVGAPLVPDVLTGFGTATTFQVYVVGAAVEGGAFDWSDVCAYCLVRIAIAEGQFTVADSEGIARALDPGAYELREYRGFFLFSQRAPHDFAVQLHGLGKIEKLG